MRVTQGLTNNLEDLHRALEGLTEATAQEREENAVARAQNEVLQAAVNALQFQMASMGQGVPANKSHADATTTPSTNESVTNNGMASEQ